MASEHYVVYSFFFFNDTATTEIYTLSLHDALPISPYHNKGLFSLHNRQFFGPQYRDFKSCVLSVEAEIGRAHV